MKYYYIDKRGERCGPVDYGGLLTRIEAGNVDELTVRRARPGEEGYFEPPVLTVHTLPALVNLFFPGFGLFLQRRYAQGFFLMFMSLLGTCVSVLAGVFVLHEQGFLAAAAVGAGTAWYFLLLCSSTVAVMEFAVEPLEGSLREIPEKTKNPDP